VFELIVVFIIASFSAAARISRHWSKPRYTNQASERMDSDVGCYLLWSYLIKLEAILHNFIITNYIYHTNSSNLS